MEITYKVNHSITTDQFIALLNESSLGERRPVDDAVCIKGMLDKADILVTAWNDDHLVGVARSVTDFHYCCYLSDLAVGKDYQRKGIGIKLQQITQDKLGPKCKIILLAAPDAAKYYPKIGFTGHGSCWVLPREASIEQGAQPDAFGAG